MLGLFLALDTKRVASATVSHVVRGKTSLTFEPLLFEVVAK
jgi:hypothetical protein